MRGQPDGKDSLDRFTADSGFQDTGPSEGYPKWKKKGASTKGVSQHIPEHRNNMAPDERLEAMPEFRGGTGDEMGGMQNRKPKFKMPSAIFGGSGNDKTAKGTGYNWPRGK